MKEKILLTRDDNTPEEQLQILKECIRECRHCNCVATVRQIAKTSNIEYNQLDVEQHIFETDCAIRLNDGLAYAQLTTNQKENLLRIRQMHETVLKRGTDKFLENQTNDYFLIMDLLKEDERLSIFYTFSLFQPQFFSLEHDTLEIALPIDRVHYFKEQLTRDEIEYEALEQGGYGEDDDNGNGYESGFGYGENGAYISGESFL